MKTRTPLIVINSKEISKSDIEFITECFKGMNPTFQSITDKQGEHTDITKFPNIPLLIFTEDPNHYKSNPQEDRESVSVTGKNLATHPHAAEQVRALWDMKFTNYSSTKIVQHPSTNLGLFLKRLSDLGITGELCIRDSVSKIKDLLIPASQTTLSLSTIKSTFPLAYPKTLLFEDERKKYYIVPDIDSADSQYRLQILNTHLSKIKNTTTETSQIAK